MTDLAELVTVLVCTSPTANDPSLAAINETITSVRNFSDLYSTPLLIGCDGARPEQRHLAAAYEQKKQAIVDVARKGCEVLEMPAWGHQANVARMLLERATTPLILFLEHDTPFTPNVEIDWPGCAQTIIDGELDLIRFHHESQVIPEHAHLMIDDDDKRTRRIPYLRTVQWSQRPHLARADWYRNLIGTYFARSSRCFVEDCLYGVVNYAWRIYGEAGWNRHKLALYADPEPTMQRSYHLDGRAGDPKGPQVFAFSDHSQPEGAPAATLARVFE